MKTWDEFAPNLYEAVAILRVDGKKERRTEQFGMRKLTNEHSLLQINGRRLFLRGTLECCVFPLTGYPPTGEPGWEKVFRTARNYGFCASIPGVRRKQLSVSRTEWGSTCKWNCRGGI